VRSANELREIKLLRVSRRWYGLVGLALVLGMAAPRTGYARSGKSGEARARKMDKAGKKAFKHRAYDDAVIAFKAAHAASPTPGRLFNLGKAYQRVGNLQKAIETFERYVQESEDADDAADVEEALGFMRAKLEQTKVAFGVTTYPEGATFQVSTSGYQHAGETPWAAYLDPGRYEVLIEKEGFVTVKKTVVLVLEEPQDLSIVLKPPPKKPKRRKKPKKPKKPKGPPPPPPPPPPPLGVGWTTWGVFGGAAAALVASGVLVGLSQSKASDYDDWRTGSSAHTRAEVEETGDSARTLGIASVAALAVGGAAAVTGGVLVWLGGDGKTAGVSMTW